MTIRNRLIALFAWGLIATTLSPAAFALPEDSTCEGNWYMDIKTSSAEEGQKGWQGAWVPATVYLDRELASCTRKIIIQQPQGGRPYLSGQVSNHDYELKNASRQDLPVFGDDKYVLTVNGKTVVNFWVYLPGAKDFSPGNYSSTLEFSLKDVKNETTSSQVYSFSYQVKPYVRAKLSNTNDSWIKPTGMSVKLQLGDLTQRNRRDLPVYVESNGFVSMAFSSQNKGKLVNVTNKQNTVPYSLMYGGQKINLADDVVIDVGQRPYHGRKLPLAFENKAEPFARAGQYEDVVTISVFAR
ncbi:hypothetical protein LRP49_23325 [Enterovibrio sp. ZSDZ35]|uniref:Fimbrial protein n=1 Tax=Enterovibrio qingdaonensis TaxID=2899818 RepID=A0ABT5QUC8_9GAMM|nr:hypothetical protein [Enterovibrio sp. ZSDZ35]MDD1784110.1 hypothetical protein [Enterovibrio sp. ZSDZ35]